MAPAIAIAEQLTKHRCIFTMSNKKVDEVFSKKYDQFPFVKARVTSFRWSPIAFLKFFHSQIASLRFALRFLKENKIDLVISFGGFSSFAFVLAAKIKKIPSILYESNVIPGKAIRISSQFADKILLPNGVSLGEKKNIEHVDFPIRQEFVDMSKADARAQLGWPPSKKIILFIGGSNGAMVFNKWVQQNFMRLAYHNVDIHCIGGSGFSEEKEITFEDCTLRMLPFCENMNPVLRACDLVIARAGAGTIAECQFCKKPMILIPHPLSADNHQLANAKKAEKQGIAAVVEQNNLESLASQILEMLSNSSILSSMQRNLEKTFVPRAAEQIASIVENFLQERKNKPKKRQT
jgi:UDP-N-acetylglucosamine--N-acetylmuramyl-(pentapeptide) pyrophosphoryl-undecaprenol N-acetylglucosamine transferase